MTTNTLAPSRQPSAPPTSNPLQGGDDRYVLSVPIMRNVAGAGAYTARTSQFRVWHPSVKLHGAATIGFRGDTQEDATIPAGFVATLDAWAKTSREAGGFPIRGNSIIPGPFALPSALPWTYEAVTGVDEWRGTATAPAGGTGLAVTGTFWLTVSWEQVGGAAGIDPNTLKRIFDSCKVMCGDFPTVFQSVGG